MRPSSGRYVGLDLSERQLERAGPGAYDQRVVSNITQRVPELIGSVDVVVSWQVLEHVRPMKLALAHVHEYLRPGGAFIAGFSGRWSAFAVLNRFVPDAAAKFVMGRLLHRDPESVFPAPYDDCTYSALVKHLAGWSSFEITARYRGAAYFAFAPLLQRLYLRFEDAIEDGHHTDLATHYLVFARK